MRVILLMLCLLFSTNMMAQNQKSKRELKKEKRAAEELALKQEVAEVVKSKKFLFIAKRFDSGTMQANTKVLGVDMQVMNNSGLSGYFIKVDGEKVKVYLPYIGKVNKPLLDDGSIDFESINYKIQYAPQVEAENGWLIGINVTDNDKKVFYELIFEINNEGEVILDCHISDRESMRFYGALKF